MKTGSTVGPELQIFPCRYPTQNEILHLKFYNVAD